ncbi:hypothetical protein ATCC90586_004966 [Pythium insidiosum]|nr:hypothetical protein ATCC90586_004966 [Pythium insidiosum]
MAATASNTNANAIKEDEDAIPIFVVRTPKPVDDADDDIPVFTPGNHDMDDLDPVVWAPDDDVAYRNQHERASSSQSSGGSTKGTTSNSTSGADSVDGSGSSPTAGSRTAGSTRHPASSSTPSHGPKEAPESAPIVTCPSGQTTVSVEYVGVFCAPQGRICSGSIANGDCPGPQLGLPFGSSCGVVSSGVQGCRANARFVSSNSTVRE